MIVSLANQARVRRYAEQWMQRKYRGVLPEQACPWWAKAACEGIGEVLGLRAVPQAGTAHWRIVPPESDDGVQPTHFEYRWGWPSDSCKLDVAGAFGQMAELHAWAAIPEHELIVDLSLPMQPANCEKLTGLRWETEQPEPLWAAVETMPDGYSYEPCPYACAYLMCILRALPYGGEFHGFDPNLIAELGDRILGEQSR